MTSEPTPLLELRDEEVFLGEEIIFRRGLACASRVRAEELWGRTCQLTIRAPDGAVATHAREPASYDGPWMIQALRHRECLNDLAAPLALGAYEIAYACEGREARRRIHVREPARPGPLVDVDFPDRLDAAPGRRVVVRVQITNASRSRLRLVEPDRDPAARVVGFVDAADPPSWSTLRRAERDVAQARHRALLDAPEHAALAASELGPDERRAYEVAFDPILSTSADPRWRPRERFRVTIGLVVHTFEPHVARPLRWLRRSTGEYLVTGALVSAGEARCRPWEWVRVSPSGG